MTRASQSIAISIGGTFSAWGVAEWNHAAGIVAFSTAAIYSLTKTAIAIRNRKHSRK